MTAYKVPTGFTVNRKCTINGTNYNPGDTLPNAVAKTLHNLSALLGNRDVVPTPDPWSRKTKGVTPTPSDVPPVVRKAIT